MEMTKLTETTTIRIENISNFVIFEISSGKIHASYTY